MTSRVSRSFEDPGYSNGTTTSYEIVTDYTGFAKIKSICALLSTLLPNANGTTVPLSVEAVFYDNDEHAIHPSDVQLPPPQDTPIATVSVPLTAHWGSYEIASEQLEPLNWIVRNRTQYVGLRWTFASPPLWYEEMIQPDGSAIPNVPQTFGRGVYKTLVWFRQPGSAWLPGFPSGMTPVSLQVVPMAVCGDNITMDSEECDGGIECPEDCQCPFNYVNDHFDRTGWAPLGCQCPDAVLLDPHWFVGPPQMQLNRSGDMLSVMITLPQARPSRWTATAGLSKWDGSLSPFPEHNWKLKDMGCVLIGSNSFLIADLFKYLDYHIVENEDYYQLDFPVTVSWWERIVFGREAEDGYQHPVDRTMTATLSIALLVQRTVATNSTIFVLDPNIIWAYVAKSVLFLIDGDFYVDLDIVTRTKSENIIINKENFWAVGKDPRTQAINWVSNLTSTNGPIKDERVQYWKLRVHLNGDPCSTNWNDNYTLSYELISTEDNVNPHRATFFLTINQFEDWCGVTAEVDAMEGVQRTYLDVDLFKPATRFWPGDMVVVGVEVVSKYGLTIENVTLISSRLEGAGLKNGAHLLYNLTTGWVHPLFETADLYGVSANCTGKTGCYAFMLNEDLVVLNKPITIYTTVWYSASGGVKRTVTMEQTQTFSRFSAVPRSAITNDDEDMTLPGARPSFLTNYSFSSPMVLAVAFVCLVPVISLVLAYFITRSRV
jgi:hypothetical protein